jgi:hypothetical protein
MKDGIGLTDDFFLSWFIKYKSLEELSKYKKGGFSVGKH